MGKIFRATTFADAAGELSKNFNLWLKNFDETFQGRQKVSLTIKNLDNHRAWANRSFSASKWKPDFCSKQMQKS